MAPVGMKRLLTGGGDCLRLADGAKSLVSTFSDVSVGVGGAAEFSAV